MLCTLNFYSHMSTMKWSEVRSLSRVWLFATPWIVAYQAPLSMGFSRQEYWSGLPFPSPYVNYRASQMALLVKNLLAKAEDVKDLRSIPGLGRSSEGWHWNPLQYSCLKNPHGQRSLAGYSPWGHKESDITEAT